MSLRLIDLRLNRAFHFAICAPSFIDFNISYLVIQIFGWKEQRYLHPWQHIVDTLPPLVLVPNLIPGFPWFRLPFPGTTHTRDQGQEPQLLLDRQRTSHVGRPDAAQLLRALIPVNSHFVPSLAVLTRGSSSVHRSGMSRYAFSPFLSGASLKTCTESTSSVDRRQQTLAFNLNSDQLSKLNATR